MRTILFCLVFILTIWQPIIAQEKVLSLPKLSPKTKIYLQEIASNPASSILPEYVYKNTNTGVYMSALIKVKPSVQVSDLQNLGVHIGTKAGAIWTVQIPISNVTLFTQTTGIDYIELDEPIYVQMDSARKAARADSVHQGIGLLMPYTGKNVVVGIIDVGFDYTHPAFYDTLRSNFRIKRVWEEKKSGTPPTGYIYGNELTDSAAMYAAKTESNKNSHGTHVAGITAGSGRGSGNNDHKRYRGMAYESELVLVGIMPDSSQWQNTGMSDMIDGMNYIYTYAQSVGKPAVANLSWGTPMGPHNGTSLFSQACDALTGTGKIFIVSAGNEGDSKIHLQKTFTPLDTVVKTFVEFNPFLTGKHVWLDVWGEENKPFCVQASLHNQNTEITNTGYICLDNGVYKINLIGSNGDTCVVTFSTSTSEFNNQPRCYVSFSSRVSDSLCFSVKSTAGIINIWNGYVYQGSGYYGELKSYGKSWASDGEPGYGATDLVAAQSAIGVGAYVTKSIFKSITGPNYSLGAPRNKLAPFSSHGPTADGRMKPDISAPGMCLVSSVNSNDSSYLPSGANYVNVVSAGIDTVTGKKYYYGQMSGTSMSAPATSGVVALMLQANPYLTPALVRSIIQQTAIKDTFTTSVNNNQWGAGKLNAYQAVLLAAITPTGIASNPKQLSNFNLFPNPNKGEFQLEYVSASADNVALEIIATDGRLLHTETWKVNAGNNLKKVSGMDLAKGIYFARIMAVSNKSNTIKTFVVE